MLSCVKIVSPLSGYVWPLERISGSVLTQRIPGRAVKRFKSTINFRNGNKTVPSRSVPAMMAPEVTHRAKVQVLASGVDSKVQLSNSWSCSLKVVATRGMSLSLRSPQQLLVPPLRQHPHCNPSDPKKILQDR